MAKSKSNLRLSGQLGDQIYSDGKQGAIVKNAPKKGTRKEQPAFDAQTARTKYLNKLAGNINKNIDSHTKNFKPSNFYNLLQERFRKEKLNNRFLLLKQIEGMEVNKRYPLQKLGDARVAVKATRDKITVVLDVNDRPKGSVGKHIVNCYAYDVLLLCWVKDSEEAVPDRQHSDWTYLDDDLPGFDLNFKQPDNTVEWLVCLKQTLGVDGKRLNAFVGEGMRIVLAGSFDKKDLELWKKRKAEKLKEEKRVEKREKEVERVKATRKRKG